MRNLLLMRHAKSSWDDPRLDDHDRPLNPRGERDAPRMGVLLRDEGLLPDRIVCSTALRARTTAQMVAQECQIEDCVTATADLYHAAADEWCRTIRQLPEYETTILCVGHNPGLEDFLAGTTGQHVVMPTAAIAHLSYGDLEWDEVDGHSDATLMALWRPKDLAVG